MRNGSLCFSQPHTLAARHTYYRRLTDVLFAYILSLVCSRGIVPFCNASSEQITQPVLQWRVLRTRGNGAVNRNTIKYVTEQSFGTRFNCWMTCKMLSTSIPIVLA